MQYIQQFVVSSQIISVEDAFLIKWFRKGLMKNYIRSSMFVGNLDKKKLLHLSFCNKRFLTGLPSLDLQSSKKNQGVEFPLLGKKNIFLPPNRKHKQNYNIFKLPKALVWSKKEKKNQTEIIHTFADLWYWDFLVWISDQKTTHSTLSSSSYYPLQFKVGFLLVCSTKISAFLS